MATPLTRAAEYRQWPRPGLIGVLLAGDVLSCDALLEMAITSGMHPDAELFYSDESRISPVSGKSEVFFKPQWSPDLLTATNYIGRFWCTLPGVLSRARVTTGDWLRFGDYDLVLRCTEAADAIIRIPKLLCERGRAHLDEVAQEKVALARALERRGLSATTEAGIRPGYYRLRREVKRSPRVSIIIPTRASGGLIKPCLESLRALTAYSNFEIICVENIPASDAKWKEWVRANADRVIAISEPFNWSRFNNLGAAEASGEFLLFLNDDTEIIEPEWLDALLEHAERQEVGVVGARLLYPDRTLQHAGIVWTPKGGRHGFRHLAESDPGYFALARTERNVIAVTGACLLTRRDEFSALGGFDESHTIVNNDVDFCLRMHERGKLVVYTPYAALIHRELGSRGHLDDVFDAEAFERRWGRLLRSGDPFYHPSLNRDAEDFSYDPEPLDRVFSGHPLFEAAQIRRILAVKLDHIGDFIAALPALRRLRELFPGAELYLLAAPASAALAAAMPVLSGIIEFEYFFPRSDLPARELSPTEIAALRVRLAPYQFDLAIDLRKAPETRWLLPLTGATWLAGYDRDGHFPWLDIVLEWELDPVHKAKHSSISDDLLRLVDAVAIAARPNQQVLPRPDPSNAPGAVKEIGATSDRHLICVHPGVGSRTRQWPVEYFAALIDMLVATHDADIVLIGAGDEAEIAEAVMAKVQRQEALQSLVGKLSLRELPALLGRAALFIGNNSGPHHLAAALGVPTVGIHSGAVDAREWGPQGPHAVAIRRNMSCSPCYLAHAADCPRALACLTELRPEEVYEVCRRLLVINPPGVAPAH